MTKVYELIYENYDNECGYITMTAIALKTLRLWSVH